MTYDIVYIVKPGDRNEELRHSLRSLGNLPHDKVWIVGHTPEWIEGVHSIEGNRYGAKWINTSDNIRIAAGHDGISDNFILLNDDFFIMEDASDIIDDTPYWWRYDLAEHVHKVRNSTTPKWRDMLKNALDCLHDFGVESPLSFTLHMPLLVDREKMSEALDYFPTEINGVAPEPRTIYGNYWDMGREKKSDCKVVARSAKWRGGPFVSTYDGSFKSGKVGKQIRQMFDTPSPYERS